jgi:glycosyltransferase involved in cell wall biosynthesis
MHFAVSLLNFRPGRIGGTETYLRELLAHLPEALAASGQDRVTVVMDRDLDRELPTPGLERAVLDRSGAAVVRARALEAFTPWRDRKASALFEKLAADALLFPQQSIYPRAVPGAVALTVVDVQHLVFPENIARADRLFRRAIYPWSLARADGVISISATTTETLVEYCGMKAADIDTILLGFEGPTLADTAAWAPTGRPFLYFPAVTRPHKNHIQLFETLATLWQRDPGVPELVLSGQKTPYWEVLRKAIERLGIGERVTHVGYVTREQVAGLYRGAEAVLFPTRFEGFGLPVTEAVAAGSRVVCSRLPVFEELGVPERFRIEFSDPDALSAALREPPPFGLEREPFSWAQTADETLGVLRRVAQERFRRP